MRILSTRLGNVLLMACLIFGVLCGCKAKPLDDEAVRQLWTQVKQDYTLPLYYPSNGQFFLGKWRYQASRTFNWEGGTVPFLKERTYGHYTYDPATLKDYLGGDFQLTYSVIFDLDVPDYTSNLPCRLSVTEQYRCSDLFWNDYIESFPFPIKTDPAKKMITYVLSDSLSPSFWKSEAIFFNKARNKIWIQPGALSSFLEQSPYLNIYMPPLVFSKR